MPGQAPVPVSGLAARYEQLRHAALHSRGEAFPLGLGVLAGKGVIAWQRTVAGLAPAAPLPARRARPPGPAGAPSPPISSARWPPWPCPPRDPPLKEQIP